VLDHPFGAGVLHLTATPAVLELGSVDLAEAARGERPPSKLANERSSGCPSSASSIAAT
jgi:hypothetical protein